MNNTDRLLKALKSKVAPDQELPAFFSEMSTAQYKYAVTTFAFNYYNYNEKLATEENGFAFSDEDVTLMHKALDEIVRDALLGDFDPIVREKAISKLDAFRLKASMRTKILVTYADVVALYNYVLSRLEDYSENKEYAYVDYADENFVTNMTKRLYDFIFHDKDNAVINDKIRGVLSQLPVRMTKVRFFDLLHNNLTLYIGSEVSALNGMLYRLRSACGLLFYEDPSKSVFESIGKSIVSLETAAKSGAFKSGMSKEMLEGYEADVKLLDKKIHKLIEDYTQTAELINFLYAALLSKPYVTIDANERFKMVEPVLRAVNASLLSGNPVSAAALADENFQKAEGTLEDDLLNINKLNGVFEEVQNVCGDFIEAMNLSAQEKCISYSKDLVSDSIFAALSDNKEENTDMLSEETLSDGKGGIKENVDAQMIEKVFEGLKELFENGFSGSKQLSRARMAAAISNFNVFFQDNQEIVDYIRHVLTACHDRNELCASIQLEDQLMMGDAEEI